MSDHYRTLVVILEGDYRKDEAEDLRKAIEQMKGVSKVEYGDVVGGSDHINRHVAKRELQNQLWDLLK